MNIKRNISRLAAGVSSGLMVALALPVAAFAAPAPTTVYNATPSPLPPNVASLGFEATSTSEFGDRVKLAGSDRNLNSVTVTMSDWALYSEYSGDARYAANNVSWTHPITVNIYSTSNTTTPLVSKTETVTIPWRPAANDPTTCGTAWKAPNGQCYNGTAFNATFDFSSSSIVLPGEVVVGVAYNTADYGTTPLHVAGPYNSLNVGTPNGQTASVGTDSDTDGVYWNSTYQGRTPGFTSDTDWTPNGTVALKINATSVALVGPATNKDQCKGDGWKSFNNPTYKNQGQCVSSVATTQHLEF